MFRSLKTRIAVCYSLLLIALLLVSFYLIYNDLEKYLLKQTDNQIVEKAKRSEWFGNDVPLTKIQKNVEYYIQLEGTKKVFYLLYNQEGDILVEPKSGIWKDFKIDTDKVKQFSRLGHPKKEDFKVRFPDMSVRRIGKGDGLNFIYLESSRYLRFTFRLAYIPFGNGQVLVCGQNMFENEQFLDRLQRTFWILFSVAVLVGASIGYLLSRKAMSGVDRVTKIAQKISSGSMGDRVELRNDGVEVETLANTFNQMLDQIELLLAGLKQVSDDIAHDLRTPVTRIRTLAEMTATSSPDNECRCQMGVIVEESDRLIEMINTMLEIAHTNSGVMLFEMADIDLRAIAADGVEIFQSLAEDKSIIYEIDLPEQCCTVHGNRGRLQRVISNVLDNAIKFTPEKGKVSLQMKIEADHIVTVIRDDGPGIPRDELERIFDRFYRRDPSRNIEGNGLGLCLARSITHAHGGKLFVESEVGKGSEFVLVLDRSSR